MTDRDQSQLDDLLNRAKEADCYVKLEEYDHGAWHCFIYDDDGHGAHGEADEPMDAVKQAMDELARQQQ